jgi:hypothetical protein
LFWSGLRRCTCSNQPQNLHLFFLSILQTDIYIYINYCFDQFSDFKKKYRELFPVSSWLIFLMNFLKIIIFYILNISSSNTAAASLYKRIWFFPTASKKLLSSSQSLNHTASRDSNRASGVNHAGCIHGIYTFLVVFLSQR